MGRRRRGRSPFERIVVQRKPQISPLRSSVAIGPATTSIESSPFRFVIPSVTRISYFTALANATYVVLRKENRHASVIEAVNSRQEIRGSRGICSFYGSFLEMFFEYREYEAMHCC